MHVKPLSLQRTSAPGKAGIRETLEVTLLFLDVVAAAIGIVRKEPWSGGHDHDHDHDHHHGHTH